jgi:hypothetical protein
LKDRYRKGNTHKSERRRLGEFNYDESSYDPEYYGEPLQYDTPEGYFSMVYESFFSEYYNPDNYD